MPIATPQFMLTLPRKAQRRLPDKHSLTIESTVGRVGMKKKEYWLVACTCGWKSQPFDVGDDDTARIMTENHLRDEAAKLT